MQQVEMISLEDLVPKNHSYRDFFKLWSFKFVEKRLQKLEKSNPHKGYGLLRLFKCLLLQFMENRAITNCKEISSSKYLVFC